MGDMAEKKLDRVRILLVDDDREVLRNLAVILSLEDYFVMTASSGAEASVLIREHPFDIVITDLRMSIIDGHEIARRTRAAQPQAAIIVTSRYIDDQARAWIDEQNLIGIEKPFNIHKLSAILHSLCPAPQAH